MIKKATTEDIPKIIYMASRIFPETYGAILSKDQIDYMMNMMYSYKSLYSLMIEKDAQFYIYYENKAEQEDAPASSDNTDNIHEDLNPVGYVSFFEDKSSIYHLDKIYVLSSHQKQGIGKQLMNFAIDRMKTLSARRMELNVNRNNPAINFYKSLGMRVQTEGDFPIGSGYFMNDYIMELDLQ